MYDAIEDPYCYPGTTVLKNRAGHRTQRALTQFETAMSAQRADEPLPIGRLSVRHYQAIHQHLFQDVFPWAGKLRTVRISKDGSMFCYAPSRLRLEAVSWLCWLAFCKTKPIDLRFGPAASIVQRRN